LSGYIVTKEVEFDAGHRVPDHNSKCFNVHGHRYRVRAYVEATELQLMGSSKGMVVDFGDLKMALNEICGQFDHKLLVFTADPIAPDLMGLPGAVGVPYTPTAENIARDWYDRLTHVVPWGRLKQIVVWETPSSRAVYYG
jgi:6-pyruvoyltetrahydropterin/6-carboxytetrahydropterin synthase